MATLRSRVVDFINSNRGERWTNGQLADALGAPMPSVRRATLQAMRNMEIADAGPTNYNAGVVTYVANDVN